MTLFDLPPAGGPGGGDLAAGVEPDASPEATAPAAPTGPLVRVRLLVAYDGGSFHGFAPQPGQRTVAGVLLEGLERVLRCPPGSLELVCAGRTDAGVHGWGQVCHVDVPAGSLPDLDRLRRSLDGLAGGDVLVRSVDLAPDGFDARHSALWRRYRYTVLNEPLPDPFLARTAWHVAPPLDLAPMVLGCDPLLGEHDFASFCRRPPEGATTVRRILDARWTEDRSERGGRLLRFEVTATAFCHQMVRSLVGTLVDVGLGRMRAGDLRSVLAARDRSAAGPVAPPHGLCLWEVGYPAP